jgi:hypothetical protein
MKKRNKPRLVRFNAEPPRLLIVRAIGGDAAREMTLKLALSGFVTIRHGQPRCA